jgi:hypothetical protein
MKQETVEQAAERILANNIDDLKDLLQDDDIFYFYKGVIQCYGEVMAEYQAERMYSKEDLRTAWIAAKNSSDFNEWFEQFKKK